MKFRLLEMRSYMIDEDNKLFDMLQEIPEMDEFGQTNVFFGKSKEEIKEIISYNVKIAYSLETTRNVKPVEFFVLYAESNPVCVGGLRLRLNNYWKRHGGNLWYKTRPSERNKGYATKFVELVCDRAKEFGLKEITAQCNKLNLGSNRVLQKNDFSFYENSLCLGWNDTNFYIKILKK